MTASPFRFTGGPGMGYVVQDRYTSAVRGVVRQREQRHNLIRVYVTRWWEATLPNRSKLVDEHGNPERFATRADAAQALADAAKAAR